VSYALKQHADVLSRATYKGKEGLVYVNFMKPAEETAADYRGQIRVPCGPSAVAVWIPSGSKFVKRSLQGS
jgi:hypothetical protein